ncbi:hypothetical protein FOZ61_007809 [Perkinsus olseni]|uniref:Uncharacterized protein n=1 Tax=Perkinsus olseni TaxID=32597 RepID=A0A7J6M8J4_PEROL|nr:hypothetical protein FOZ61_007809 [Perkinsus olseni]KAF4673520.1 hypothetical protein FOL46_007010 [Perkinsus olseni]
MPGDNSSAQKSDAHQRNGEASGTAASDNNTSDHHECSVCHNSEPIDKVSKDGMRVTRVGEAPANENGPSWLKEDGTVDPIEFALAEVGYLDFEDDNFQDDFAYHCAMYGFKPWDMW